MDQQNLRPITRAQWVAALLSGDFRQASDTMQDAAGNNCCLGVACRVAGIDLASLRNEDSEADLEVAFIAAIDKQDPRFENIEEMLHLTDRMQNFLAHINDKSASTRFITIDGDFVNTSTIPIDHPAVLNFEVLDNSFTAIAHWIAFDSWLHGKA